MRRMNYLTWSTKGAHAPLVQDLGMDRSDGEVGHVQALFFTKQEG